MKEVSLRFCHQLSIVMTMTRAQVVAKSGSMGWSTCCSLWLSGGHCRHNIHNIYCNVWTHPADCSHLHQWPFYVFIL